jgi:hypothetical protein
MEIIGTNEFEDMYWGSYSTEELKVIVGNTKLLRAFRDEAKKRLEIRNNKNK